MYLLNKIIELIILRYNRIMCYEWTQETTWRVVSISTKYLKKKEGEEKERKKRKAASSQNQKRGKERKLSLFFEIPTSHFHFRPITPVNGTNDHHDQKESRYWQRWRAGKDLDFEKKKEKKKKDRLKPRGGRERLTKRHASSKKKAYKRQWPKCALVSRFSRSGKLFLDSDRLDIRAQISAVPSLSLSLCPFKRKVHGWNVAAVYFDLWREIEKKGR